jgi:hypothetical protein
VLRKNRIAACVMLASFATSACQDAATSVLPDARVSKSPSASGGRSASEDGGYVCLTTDRRTTDGHPYQHTRVGLHFPKSELAPGGARMRFTLRIQGPGQSTVATAVCTIPYTRAAAERLYRRFAFIFRKRATLDPFTFPAVVDERNVYLAERRQGVGPRFDTTPTYAMPGVTAYGYQPYEGGSTGWTGTGDWGWGSQGDTYQSGGGDAYDSGYNDEACNPGSIWCEFPLRSSDETTLKTAIARYVKPASAIPDPDARAKCQAMANEFDFLLNYGVVYRGIYDTQPGDPTIDPHSGVYDTQTGRMHFDPSELDAATAGDPNALRDLANTALHEAAHALGYDHPNGFVNFPPYGPQYTDSPFNLLSPGANSCLNWN